MASHATDAADAIRRAARQYQAFIQAAEILDKFGSLENATAEGQRALSAIRGEVESVKTELAALKAQSMAVQTEQAEIIANANATSAAIMDDGKEKAEAIINLAQTQAQNITHDAQIAASSIKGSAERESADLYAKVASLKGEVASLNERATTAQAEADAAEKRLTKVKDAIAKLAAG